MHQPLHKQLTEYDVDTLITLFADQKDLMILSSKMLMGGYGRYSYICFDAFDSLTCKGPVSYNPFQTLQDKLNTYSLQNIPHLPPFQGGVVGYFGYEASHYLEKLPAVIDTIQLPDMYFNFYSHVIAIDHATQASWVIATGFPETDELRRLEKARRDIERVFGMVESWVPRSSRGISGIKNVSSGTDGGISLHSNFDAASYADAVNITKDYILNGDIFEANLSQQFSTPFCTQQPLALYFKLMQNNPAPFSAFFTLPDQGYIISASPERFIKLTGNLVETCPIKGTRKRSSNPQVDQRLAQELLNSEKDHAEHMMIVDLMRNDLSRVCDSVNVEELALLKPFKTVHHLVSKITGTLNYPYQSMDLMQATFPPGSVTGAPKIRSMEIISELEQQTRGPYCGCLGYIGFNGDMDMSVIIRTYFIHQNRLFFSAGGAIVLDSDPDEEYQETLTKAEALIRSLRQPSPPQLGHKFWASNICSIMASFGLRKREALSRRLRWWPSRRKLCFLLRPNGHTSVRENYETDKDSPKTKNRILIIDNYDSFVFNLARYVKTLGHQTMVIRNDALTLQDIEQINPTHIILSPGPGGPSEAGLCISIVKAFAGKIPILGVCLGHQVIGHVYNGTVTHAQEPMHGKSCLIEHNGQGLFQSLPNPLRVGRYHSLIVEEPFLDAALKITSRTTTGEIMAFAHETLPVYGVQFHPESVMTEHGLTIIDNFIHCND